MSHAHSKQAANKGLTKTQRIFVPKNHDQTQNRTPKLPSPSPTLSNSLRQSLPKQSDASTSSSGTESLASRVRKEENGDWVSNSARGGNFVNYLPQDEAVAAGLGAEEGGLDPVESQRVVDLLNGELSRLLKLNPKEFWREVASDTSLHEFLDSFLQFRSRWYDFPHHGAKGMVAGVIVGEFELSRRVFMVLYRISSNRDPGARAADNLSPKDHGVLLQEKRLLDLPKLLDICAVYGHENEDSTKILVGNAIKAQPRIHNNLTSVMSHFLGIVHTLHQRCSSSVEVLCSSGSHRDHGSSHLCADMLEVMDFINDAIVSLDAFVSAYMPATVFFSSPVETSYGNEELIGILAKLHDSLLPSLKRGFQIILKFEDGMASIVAVGLKMLSMRIVNFGWRLLEFCYLSDKLVEDNLPIPAATKMFPANVEDPVIRADILVQTFREISEVSLCTELNQNSETFLQNMEQKFYIMTKMENLQNTGWIFMDAGQLEYLSFIFKGSKKITSMEPNNVVMPVTSNKAHIDEDAAIMESKISQIKDLFPDYGRGFLGACLEAYNQNPEEVIQRILEGTLHEDLQTLDTSLETMLVPKTTVTVSRNDKGKGKLVEPGPLSSTNLVAAGRVHPNEGPLVSSSSSLGRFVRKSKAETHDSDTLDNRKEKDSAVTAALLSQYEYEDEYDDSFDDLGLSVADSGLEENEILGDRISSNVGKSWEKETETSSQIPASSKWGSRKKPQYYVKDGKNYSYKVDGAVAVANASEASVVTQSQKELIYGLGRGGNHPLGAVKKLTEASEQLDKQPADVCAESEVRGPRNPRGRGRRGGFGRQRDPNVEQEKQSGGVSEVELGGENMGNQRERGRRGGGGGGRNHNHNRKDRSMNKHFTGLSGY